MSGHTPWHELKAKAAERREDAVSRLIQFAATGIFETRGEDGHLEVDRAEERARGMVESLLDTEGHTAEAMRRAMVWIYERAGQELWASRRRPDMAGHRCDYRGALQAVKQHAKKYLHRGPDASPSGGAGDPARDIEPLVATAIRYGFAEDEAVALHAVRGLRSDLAAAQERAAEAESRTVELEALLRAEREQHRHHCARPDCGVHEPLSP